MTQVLRVGSKYLIELIPKTALTPSQMRMGLDILKQRERELEEKYGTHLVEAVFQPGKVTVVVETLRETPMVVGGMAMPLIVWAILALLGIAGIGIIAYKLSEMAKAIPWEMVVPVAALGFIGLIMYFISR